MTISVAFSCEIEGERNGGKPIVSVPPIPIIVTSYYNLNSVDRDFESLCRVWFNFGAISLMVHWPSELGLCRRFAPVVALRRPGRRRPSTGRRPEAHDLSRPGTRKNAPILKRTHPLWMVLQASDECAKMTWVKIYFPKSRFPQSSRWRVFTEVFPRLCEYTISSPSTCSTHIKSFLLAFSWRCWRFFFHLEAPWLVRGSPDALIRPMWCNKGIRWPGSPGVFTYPPARSGG
jgi:hypothetical protein